MRERPSKMACCSMGWRGWLLTCMCAIAAASGPADGKGGFSSFNHAAWTLRDGAPADIWAIAQSRDGYLWLGTGFGLYRFDGVNFSRFEPRTGDALPSYNITAVAALPSGELWIGYYRGGVSRIHDGRATHFGADDGFPADMTYRIVEDAHGDVWVATGSGLLRYRAGAWADVCASADFAWDGAYWVEQDREGNLWVATGTSLVVRPAGEARFEDTGIAADREAVLAASVPGEVWVSDASGGTRPVRRRADGRYEDATDEFPALADVRAARLLFRDDGSLWGTRRGRGLFRIALPGGDTGLGGRTADANLQFFTRAQGLTSDTAVPLLEDREGNLWVGSVLGLNRFRHRNVLPLPRSLSGPDGYDQAIHADDGSVLIVSLEGTMMGVDRAGMQRILDGAALAPEIAGTRASTWWFREGSGLWRYDEDGRRRVDYPGEADGQGAHALLVDYERRPWLSVRGKGVFVLDGDRWHRRDEVPRPAPTIIAAGLDGRIWFGYEDGRIAVLDGERVTVHKPDPTLSIGPVTALHSGKRHTIAAGERGIARFDGVRFRTVSSQDDLTGVTAVLESDDDHIWLNGSQGVAKVAGSAVVVAMSGASPHLDYLLFGQSDGLPGVALQAKPVPSAVAGDGLLWFNTNGGVAVIDPEGVRSNSLPPDVHVLAISTGSMVLAGDGPRVLPERTSNLQITYTATSLSAPERVRFRYRLHGVDAGWREAGTRREAFYTNLGPGDYRFHVIAANNDGVWNEVGRSVEFRIRPTFFQSPWFALTGLALSAMALYIGYLFHMRQLAIRMRAKLEARHLERERIARELHDTLLQSMQGLILGLHGLSRRLEPGSSARQSIEAMARRAQSVLVEGRERVQGLRSDAGDGEDLAGSLALVAAEVEAAACTLAVRTSGEPKPLQPQVRDELYRAGREALTNALRHASARHIDVHLELAQDAVRLWVSDDGVGIQAQYLGAAGRDGHWGLVGMRERLEAIGGTLDIRSTLSGATVCASVPAERAYHGRRPGWPARLIRPRRP